MNPWEESLKIKVRPHFLNMKSGVVLMFLLLTPLPFFFFIFLAILGIVDLGNVDPSQKIWPQLVGYFLTGLGFITVCTRIYRRARRAAMLPGSALTKKDTRSIVLYLRSFQDDSGIRLRARAANGRILPEILIPIAFEEVVTDHLWGFGPVLAIGDPKTKGKTAPLGAARDYATDLDWQNQVTELMRQASLIVGIAGHTSGFVWEINTVITHGFLSKFVLLLPPVGKQEMKARWRFLAINVPSLNLPSETDLDRARAVIFQNEQAILIYGNEFDDRTYEAVLDQAALAIIGASQNHSETPQSSATLTRQLLRKFASGLSIFVRSALMLLIIGVFLIAFMTIDKNRIESSHPFAHSSIERSEFVTGFSKGCREDNPELSEDVSQRYCSCVANRVADAVTYGELNAQEDSKTNTTGNVSKGDASYHKKVEETVEACSEEIFGQ